MKTYPNLLERIAHPRQTRRHYQKIKTEAGQQAELYHSFIHAVRNNDFKYAQVVADKMIAEFPHDSGIHSTVAGHYSQKGDDVNFLKHIAISLALDPEAYSALSRLTRFLVNQNQMPLARAVHERAWAVYVKMLRYFRTKPAELAQKREEHFALLDRWATSTSPQKKD